MLNDQFRLCCYEIKKKFWHKNRRPTPTPFASPPHFRYIKTRFLLQRPLLAILLKYRYLKVLESCSLWSPKNFKTSNAFLRWQMTEIWFFKVHWNAVIICRKNEHFIWRLYYAWFKINISETISPNDVYFFLIVSYSQYL